MYNLTKLTEAENFYDIVVFSNSVTNPISVMGVITVGIFFILMVSFLRFGIISALLTASLISFVLSGLLAWGGLVPTLYPFTFLAILSFTFLYSVFVSKS